MNTTDGGTKVVISVGVPVGFFLIVGILVFRLGLYVGYDVGFNVVSYVGTEVSSQ